MTPNILHNRNFIDIKTYTEMVDFINEVGSIKNPPLYKVMSIILNSRKAFDGEDIETELHSTSDLKSRIISIFLNTTPTTKNSVRIELDKLSFFTKMKLIHPVILNICDNVFGNNFIRPENYSNYYSYIDTECLYTEITSLYVDYSSFRETNFYKTVVLYLDYICDSILNEYKINMSANFAIKFIETLNAYILFNKVDSDTKTIRIDTKKYHRVLNSLYFNVIYKYKDFNDMDNYENFSSILNIFYSSQDITNITYMEDRNEERSNITKLLRRSVLSNQESVTLEITNIYKYFDIIMEIMTSNNMTTSILPNKFELLENDNKTLDDILNTYVLKLLRDDSYDPSLVIINTIALMIEIADSYYYKRMSMKSIIPILDHTIKEVLLKDSYFVDKFESIPVQNYLEKLFKMIIEYTNYETIYDIIYENTLFNVIETLTEQKKFKRCFYITDDNRTISKAILIIAMIQLYIMTISDSSTPMSRKSTIIMLGLISSTTSLIERYTFDFRLYAGFNDVSYVDNFDDVYHSTTSSCNPTYLVRIFFKGYEDKLNEIFKRQYDGNIKFLSNSLTKLVDSSYLKLSMIKENFHNLLIYATKLPILGLTVKKTVHEMLLNTETILYDLRLITVKERILVYDIAGKYKPLLTHVMDTFMGELYFVDVDFFHKYTSYCHDNYKNVMVNFVLNILFNRCKDKYICNDGHLLKLPNLKKFDTLLSIDLNNSKSYLTSLFKYNDSIPKIDDLVNLYIYVFTRNLDNLISLLYNSEIKPNIAQMIICNELDKFEEIVSHIKALYYSCTHTRLSTVIWIRPIFEFYLTLTKTFYSFNKNSMKFILGTTDSNQIASTLDNLFTIHVLRPLIDKLRDSYKNSKKTDNLILDSSSLEHIPGNTASDIIGTWLIHRELLTDRVYVETFQLASSLSSTDEASTLACEFMKAVAFDLCKKAKRNNKNLNLDKNHDFINLSSNKHYYFKYMANLFTYDTLIACLNSNITEINGKNYKMRYAIQDVVAYLTIFTANRFIHSINTGIEVDGDIFTADIADLTNVFDLNQFVYYIVMHKIDNLCNDYKVPIEYKESIPEFAEALKHTNSPEIEVLALKYLAFISSYEILFNNFKNNITEERFIKLKKVISELINRGLIDDIFNREYDVTFVSNNKETVSYKELSRRYIYDMTLYRIMRGVYTNYYSKFKFYSKVEFPNNITEMKHELNSILPAEYDLMGSLHDINCIIKTINQLVEYDDETFKKIIISDIYSLTSVPFYKYATEKLKNRFI